MKKTCFIVLKIIMLILFILTLVIGIIIVLGALQEKSPEHPLDFQDINKTVLDKPINSVEDGLPYATSRAHEWRQDAVLTGLQIISNGKDEIINNNGRLKYYFEFEYFDKNKPGGIIIISINSNSNCIELVTASHDGEYKMRNVKELPHNNLSEKIKKVYDVAINTIGYDEVFKNEQPFVRVRIDSEIATFEESLSQVEPNTITNRLKIDIKTFNIIK